MAVFDLSFENYKQEVVNAIQLREDFSEDAAEQIAELYDDDLANHFQQGDRVDYVATLICRRYVNEQ